MKNKLVNKFSFLAVAVMIFSSALTHPVKAMELEEAQEELATYSRIAPQKNLNLEVGFNSEETSRCVKKIVRCWTKERTTTRIMHNIYSESTRALQCVWNFLWCRGCKHNKRLEKDLKDM